MSELIEKPDPDPEPFQGEAPPEVIDDSHVELIEPAPAAPEAAYEVVDVGAQQPQYEMVEAQQPVVIQQSGGCGGRMGCFFATIVLLGIIAIPIYFMKQTGDFVSGIGNYIKSFTESQVETTFIESIPEVFGTDGDILEIATANATETLTEVDSFFTGETKVRIQVPVTYRYHIKLSDKWKLQAEGNVCYVLAPEIRPSLPPAIHTDRMKREIDEGFFRFNGEEIANRLHKSITPRISERAQDQQHIDLVKDESRKSVEKFVRTWLMNEGHWQSEEYSAVIVIFADEVTAERARIMEDAGPKPPTEGRIPTE
ncbi:MAG: hypothetical protein ACI8UO_000357 [Verrucomicrobiales bacterium]|jgi:hypothetical protein